MGSVSRWARSGAALAIALTVLLAPAGWADGPVVPADPPSVRLQPPVGVASNARLQPPVGVTRFVIWLAARMGIPIP
jgi:hypothetical protein